MNHEEEEFPPPGSGNKLVEKVPPTLWLQILWRLDHTDITNLLCTCKYLYEMMRQDKFWRDLVALREAADHSPLAYQPSRKRFKQMTTLKRTGNFLDGPGVVPCGTTEAMIYGTPELDPPRPVIPAQTPYKIVFPSVPPGRYLVAIEFVIPSHLMDDVDVMVFAHTSDRINPRYEQTQHDEEPSEEICFYVNSIHKRNEVFETPTELLVDGFKSVVAGLYFGSLTRCGSPGPRVQWIELRLQEGPVRTPSMQVRQSPHYHKICAANCRGVRSGFLIPNYGDPDCPQAVWVRTRSVYFQVEFSNLEVGSYSFLIEYYGGPNFDVPNFEVDVCTHKPMTKSRSKSPATPTSGEKNLIWSPAISGRRGEDAGRILKYNTRSQAGKRLCYDFKGRSHSHGGWTDSRITNCVTLVDEEELAVRVVIHVSFSSSAHFVVRHMALIKQAAGVPLQRFSLRKVQKIDLVLGALTEANDGEVDLDADNIE